MFDCLIWCTEHYDPVLVSQEVCVEIYKGVTTSQLNELVAETTAAMIANHPDYSSVRLFSFLAFFCGSYYGLKANLCGFVFGAVGCEDNFPLALSFFLFSSLNIYFF